MSVQALPLADPRRAGGYGYRLWARDRCMDLVTVAADWLRAQEPAVALVVLVVASLVGAWVVARLTLALVPLVTSRTATATDDVVLAELRPAVVATVGLAGFVVAGRELALDAASSTLLVAGTVSVLVLVWARTLVRLGRRTIATVDAESEVADFAPIFENLWSLLVVVGGLLALLTVWDVDVTPLLASAGIVGIAVGFAARDTVANFFGSLMLYLDGTYTVGDYVELADGTAGTVLDVTVRSTRLVTRDNVVVTVPNSVLNASRVSNRSMPAPQKRVRVPVGVAYGSDVDSVEAVLLEAAAGESLVARNPEPSARFRRFGDSTLEYELLCWVRDPLHEGRAVHRLNRALYAGLAAADVDIPFPQRVLHVRETGAGGTARDPGPRPEPVAAPDTRPESTAEEPLAGERED